MLSLLKSINVIKVAVLTLIAGSLIFIGVSYVKYNGNNVAWCLANGNQCRVARIKALQQDVSSLQETVETAEK